MNNQQNLINIRDRMSPALVKKQGVWSREDTKCWCCNVHALNKLWELHAGS